jgi:hypothetical protein
VVFLDTGGAICENCPVASWLRLIRKLNAGRISIPVRSV